ncbi:MAG: hypothetical protein CMH56_09950 [Myxococcales bacterium]|nr:hypothetical protein [Myxococcales bacterium]|tara:strand:+ start:406 stop:744 length:339 start_codon:yes stop_codon:yes gene_type:complete
MSENDNGDEAGKLMGWSLGSGMKKKQFEDLVKFPCDFSFKIIGVASDDFEDTVIKAIEAHRGAAIQVVSSAIKPSSQKKYTSLTLTLHVTDSQTIYDVYDACEKLPNIKFVL